MRKYFSFNTELNSQKLIIVNLQGFSWSLVKRMMIRNKEIRDYIIFPPKFENIMLLQ